MPSEIVSISRRYMTNAKEISVGKKNEAAKNVEHVFILVKREQKYLALKRILDNNPDIYGIVFCRTRQETKEVADHLMHDGYNADALHGDLSQAQRDTVMQKFRIRNIQLLVATDVAARSVRKGKQEKVPFLLFVKSGAIFPNEKTVRCTGWICANRVMTPGCGRLPSRRRWNKRQN